MGESTGISWTDHTHNEWIGCDKTSPGCKNCYAENATPTRVFRAKGLEVWGPAKSTPRNLTSKANRRKPFAWNRAALKDGVRRRVFCSSLSDVFEDHPSLPAWRADLWKTIEACDGLDWQLLTKRPENITRMVPPAWLDKWPAHVWIGTTVEDQKRAEERIPHLLSVPAAVRFLSCEPLLEAVDLRDHLGSRCVFNIFGHSPSSCSNEAHYRIGISWVIVGGESGTKAREFDLAWPQDIVRQCNGANVPVWVKQAGDNPVDSALVDIFAPDGTRHYTRPFGDPDVDEALKTTGYTVQIHRPKYKAHHGADMREWPEFIRRQSFPVVAP